MARFGKRGARWGRSGRWPARRVRRLIAGLVLLGISVLAWVSLLSFSPADPPLHASSSATQPGPPPLANAAGLAGAYLAYGILRYLGAGAYAMLVFLPAAAGLLIFRQRVPGLPVRLAGAVLLMAAISAAVYMAAPSRPPGPPHGAAGSLGEAAGGFLLEHFAALGGWVILILAFIVGAGLTAERQLLAVPAMLRKVCSAWEDAGAGASASAAAAMKARAPGGQAQPGPPTPVEAAERSRWLEEIRRSLTEAATAGLYELPSVDLLAVGPQGQDVGREASAAGHQEVLQRTLREFKVAAEVLGHQAGPVVTVFELSLAPGVKVAEVLRLAEDLARALGAPAVRILSPLPGRATVGVEVPNEKKELVRLRDLMALAGDAAGRMALPMYLGKGAVGEAMALDLVDMPHVLIAGATGSGKSICLHAILMGLLMTRRPADVRLILVDPKMVEFAAYEGLPHLLCPPVTEMSRAAETLGWAAGEMDRRYGRLREAGVRSIAEYRRLTRQGPAARPAQPPAPMPYIAIVVDELADLMMTAGKEVEAHIVRIAQKARAVGIHLVLATQRPSVDVVTGLIKANMPCRISFRTASQVESRIILDQNGAEDLLGRGDMLVLRPGTSVPIRGQGVFVDDAEIRAVTDDLRRKAARGRAPG